MANLTSQDASVLERARCFAIWRRYRRFTMIPRVDYVANLLVALRHSEVPGCVVECGVWRGGMAAGLADILGIGRHYFLFDSFEGLPPPKPIDGAAAAAWAADKTSPGYHDNCTAGIEWAQRAMARSRARHVTFVKGWFQDSLPTFTPPQEIAVLRLDADWYESTLACLRRLVPFMASQGVILIDDYYTWDGCAKAVHDHLAEIGTPFRIATAFGRVCTVKQSPSSGLKESDPAS